MKTIELQGFKNRKGPNISLVLYEKVSDFIISAILDHRAGIISLLELLDQAQKQLCRPGTGIQPWHIMQVKIDLQERGILTTSLDRQRNQIISIKRKSRNKHLRDMVLENRGA